jgi:amino acid permease
MPKISELESQVRNEIIIILKDTLEDRKKVIRQFQIITLILFIFSMILLSAISVYFEHSFHNFLSQYDYQDEVVEQKIDTEGNGNITEANKYSVRK